jgi:predicted transcriptional regulator
MTGRIPMVSLIQTLAVAEHLNFRHAANVLGVTQSSVSSRVKALEETLGVQLFERRHHSIRLIATASSPATADAGASASFIAS